MESSVSYYQRGLLSDPPIHPSCLTVSIGESMADYKGRRGWASSSRACLHQSFKANLRVCHVHRAGLEAVWRGEEEEAGIGSQSICKYSWQQCVQTSCSYFSSSLSSLAPDCDSLLLATSRRATSDASGTDLLTYRPSSWILGGGLQYGDTSRVKVLVSVWIFHIDFLDLPPIPFWSALCPLKGQ